MSLKPRRKLNSNSTFIIYNHTIHIIAVSIGAAAANDQMKFKIGKFEPQIQYVLPNTYM